jgi:RNA polymerase sigma-70 factor (ECF subfamily)
MGWLPKLASRPAMSDEQAMRQLRLGGDHAAFAELMRRWERPIRRLCIRMTCDEHRGEDLAQEAFARVFAKRRQFQEGAKFSTWLWRIALNLCLEDGRRRRARPAEDAAADVDGGHREPAPDARAEQREQAELVRRALLRLSDDYRAVVVLREYEGLKYREIAELLDVPEGTVKWRMAQALDQLSRELKLLAADDAGGRAARPITLKTC